MVQDSSADERWMRRALQLAESSAANNEVPVGAIVVLDNKIIGEGANGPIGQCDPTAHAEIQALRDACEKQANYRLPGATLYVTIEPCTMCVGAMVHARISRLVFGATEPKSGAVVSQNNLLAHPAMNTHIEFSDGVLADECSAIMTGFFAKRRDKKKALKEAVNQAELTTTTQTKRKN
jgi:tRNA(adenine34) deaminase